MHDKEIKAKATCHRKTFMRKKNTRATHKGFEFGNEVLNLGK
jgi:hypothetical protein